MTRPAYGCAVNNHTISLFNGIICAPVIICGPVIICDPVIICGPVIFRDPVIICRAAQFRKRCTKQNYIKFFFHKDCGNSATKTLCLPTATSLVCVVSWRRNKVKRSSSAAIFVLIVDYSQLRKLSHSENRHHLCNNSRSTTANQLHNFMVAFHHHFAYVLKGLVQLLKVVYQEHSLSWSLGASDQELYPAKKDVLDVMFLNALHLIKITKTIDMVGSSGKLQMEHGLL